MFKAFGFYNVINAGFLLGLLLNILLVVSVVEILKALGLQVGSIHMLWKVIEGVDDAAGQVIS